MKFPAPDLTAPTVAQSASTLAVVNGLLALPPDPGKVSVAAVLTAAGVATNYPDAPTALLAANPTDTVLVRGALAGGLNIQYPCLVDATGANVGTASVTVGLFPFGTAAQANTVIGLLSGGRVVAIAQGGPTPNSYVFSGLNLTGAARLEFYALGVTANNLVDTIELRNCVVRKTATHGAGYLGDPLFLFQSRSDLPNRPVALVVGSGCDLQNDVGPVFGGYAAGGTTITLQDRCRLVPAPGRALQEVYTAAGGATFYANATLLVDQRTSYAPIAVNQYGTGKPTRALLTQNDFDAYVLGGSFATGTATPAAQTLAANSSTPS